MERLHFQSSGEYKCALNAYGSSGFEVGGAGSSLAVPASEGMTASGLAALPQAVHRRTMLSSNMEIKRFVFILQFLVFDTAGWKTGLPQYAAVPFRFFG